MAAWQDTARSVLNGSLTSFGGHDIPADAAPRFRAQQIDNVSRYTSSLMYGNICAAVFVAVASMETDAARAAPLWAFLIISFCVFILLRRRTRTDPARQTRSTISIRKATYHSLVMGLLWGLPAAVFFVDLGRDLQLIVVVMMITILCTGAFALAAIPLAAFAFIIPVFAGAASGLLQAAEPVYIAVAALLGLYTVALLRAISAHANDLSDQFLRKIVAERATNSDGLTHLPNAIAFRTAVDHALQRTHRYGETFALFMFEVNTLGWTKSDPQSALRDDLLVKAAARLRACTRDTDVLARLDGDRFGLIAGQIETAEQAVFLAERVTRAFSSPFALFGREVRSAISAGIVLVPQDGFFADSLMDKVEQALLEASNEHHGGFVFFDRQHEATALEQRSLAADLRNALAKNEFELVYQPLFNIQQRRTTGCEALMRWNHPTRGQVPPAQFIKLAESMGLIQDIGEWAIHDGLRTAVTWPDHVRIALNMSALQFRTIDVVTALKRAITETKIDPCRVEIEITESSFISDMDAAIEVLSSIRELGVQVALDDFGTGYSSLTYLTRLPLDRLKIDRSFVERAPHIPASAVLLRSVCGLARDLGIKLTGEGVETNAQLACLIANRVDEVQGFLLGRPMSAKAIADELARNDDSDTTNLIAGLAAA